LPVDQAVTFRPSRILYMRPLTSKGQHSEILDLTTHLKTTFREDITPEIHQLAQLTLRANPIFHPTWVVRGSSRFVTSRLSVEEPTTEGSQSTSRAMALAEIRKHLLNFGTVHIRFPADSAHSSHGISVEPVSHRSRAQSFVKDSVPYLWDTLSTTTASPASSDTTFWGKPMALSGRLRLFKAVAGKKFEAARYESSNGKFALGGLLVLEEREVDPLIAAVTLIGVL
ncbi:uncharacterized protein A1O9_12433, partial [Exophiala aquamarina CBS 119918]